MQHFRRKAPLALVLLALSCAGVPGAPPPLEGPIRFSVLAVGDTGKRPPLSHHLHRQLAVGRGLAAEDRRHPGDALLLLGDNFYWVGLQRAELVRRVRENVVRPYCRFLDLSGPRSQQVADACDLPESGRHPVPLLAVLGNHDYKDPESPALQRRELPRLVANWRVPEGLTEVVEFPAGVSLVLLQSVELRQGADPAALYDALRRARGPWRILVAHHPIALARDQATPRGAAYRALVLEAIRETGVDVQLVLSGDEHNLQLIEMDPPGPSLQVVAGSGSRVRELRTSNPRVRFARASPGFARVDLVDGPAGEELVVSLFSTGNVPLFGAGPPRLVARWAVGRMGGTRSLMQAAGSTDARR